MTFSFSTNSSEYFRDIEDHPRFLPPWRRQALRVLERLLPVVSEAHRARDTPQLIFGPCNSFSPIAMSSSAEYGSSRTQAPRAVLRQARIAHDRCGSAGRAPPGRAQRGGIGRGAIDRAGERLGPTTNTMGRIRRKRRASPRGSCEARRRAPARDARRVHSGAQTGAARRFSLGNSRSVSSANIAGDAAQSVAVARRLGTTTVMPILLKRSQRVGERQQRRHFRPAPLSKREHLEVVVDAVAQENVIEAALRIQRGEIGRVDAIAPTRQELAQIVSCAPASTAPRTAARPRLCRVDIDRPRDGDRSPFARTPRGARAMAIVGPSGAETRGEADW